MRKLQKEIEESYFFDKISITKLLKKNEQYRNYYKKHKRETGNVTETKIKNETKELERDGYRKLTKETQYIISKVSKEEN